MAEVASAYITLMPSLQGFRQNLNRQIGPDLDRAGQDSGRRFGRSMGGGIKSSLGGVASKAFAPLAAAAATIGVAGFFKDAISGASDLNEAGTKVEAIFGKAGKAMVDQFAGRGAKALGQTRLEVLNAASTFGTFGKAAGLGGKDLAKFGTGFSSLSTDLASFYNTSPADAVEAIGAALRGEGEPIRKYGVLLDDATLRQEALRMGLIKTTKQALTPQQRVLAAQAQIYKQTKDAQGDFQKTSGGLANQQRILGAQFKDIKTKIGQQLLPVAVKFATFLNDKMIPGVKGLAALFLKGDFTGDLRTAFGFAEDSKPVDFLFRLRDGFIKVFSAYKAYATALLSGDTGKAGGQFEKFAQAGLKVRDFLASARDKAVAFGGWLKDDLWPALQQGYRTVLPGLQAAFATLSGSGSGSVGGAGTAFRTVGDVITKVLIPAVANFVRFQLPVLALEIRGVIEGVKLLWQGFIKWKDVVASVAISILQKFAGISEGIGKVLVALGKVPGFGWAKEAGEKLLGAAGGARKLAEDIAKIKSKNVDIGVNFKVNGNGQVTLKNGVKVDVGQFKARALGGPVRAGQPYVVGERRPELFVPSMNGRIEPRVPTGSAQGSGDGVNVRIGTVVAHDYDDFTRQLEKRQRHANALGY